MGGEASKQRIEHARKTGVLSLQDGKLSKVLLRLGMVHRVVVCVYVCVCECVCVHACVRVPCVHVSGRCE